MPSTRDLKVKMLSSEYPPCWGGVGKHVQNLCRRLHDHVDLRLMTATYGQPVEQFEINNIAPLRVNSFPLLLAQYLIALRLQRCDRAELIHIHVPHAFIPKGGNRIVSTFHVVWAEYSEAMEHQHPISLFDFQFPRLSRQLIRTERQLALMSGAVIAVSQSVKKQLVARYGIDPEKIHVIHNGVNIDLFRPSASRLNIILYVGRQTAHKGLPYLLEAFAKFVQDHKEYRLVIVGERLEGGVDVSLVRLAKRLGIADKVQFAGRIPDTDLQSILGRARCLVLPSLAEGLPLTVFEAMASETPLVATNVGGIPEVVQNGHNGLLVPPGKSGALALSMDRIVSDAKLRDTLVKGGKKTCREFSWDKVAQKTLEVYKRVC